MLSGVVVLLAFAAGLPVASSLASTSAASGPLVVRGGVAASGYPLEGSGPSGTTVRFIDRGSFWLGVLVQNGSSQPVTVVGARTPEPTRSLVRQISARFAPFTPCRDSRLPCPILEDPRHRPSAGPFVVRAHGYVAVKLGYRLASCAQARSLTVVSGRSLVLGYRNPGGTVRTQTFPLGYTRLHLKRPAGLECVPRPFSHIGLVGSFTTSPGHGTFPGSDGDTCTKTAGSGVRFRSRLFPDRSGIAWRVEITLPRYLGVGTYGHAEGARASRGKALITVSGGFGDHGSTNFREVDGTVTVTRASGRTLTGQLNAVLSGHRRFFRAYGTWRCALLN